jgi:hypothetical protein
VSLMRNFSSRVEKRDKEREIELSEPFYILDDQIGGNCFCLLCEEATGRSRDASFYAGLLVVDQHDYGPTGVVGRKFVLGSACTNDIVTQRGGLVDHGRNRACVSCRSR